MHKGWLRRGIIILFLGVIFFYRLPVVASTSTCPEGSKCIFNDTGPLLIQSQSGNIDLRATSSNKYIYLNYINTGSYGLRVSADGSLSHNGSPIVVADENFYSINIYGLSMGLKGYFGEWSPHDLLQAPDQQSFIYSINPSYWGVNNPEDLVIGVSSIYSLSKTELPLVSQLALVRDVPKDGPPRQYLQYRFNNIDRPDDWGEWIEVCDSSNNCHNFLNLLDGSSNNSLVMYQDPDMLVDSNLKVNDPSLLADCSNLYTSGGVIGCGSGGGGGGISGSGTTNYLPLWSDTSILADSILYQDSTNIGLGTASPFTNFHIYDASSGPIITLSGLDSNYRGLTIKDTENPAHEKWFVGSNDNNNFVIRVTGSNDILTVSSSDGNVGISTTNPGAKLDVNGSLAVRGAVSFTDATLYAGSGSRLLMVDNEGNVSATTTLTDFSMPDGDTGQTLRYGASDWEATSTIYIKDDGNVGIGTTSPGSKLSVEGTGYFTNTVTVGTPTASGHAATKDYVDTRTIAWNKITGFPNACTSGQVVTGMDSTSLICTTTAGATYTAGNGLSLSGTTFSLATAGTSNYLTKWTGTNTLGSSSIYISDGNVGIGTTNPASSLVVQKNTNGGRGGELSIVNAATGQVGNSAAINFGLEPSSYNADNGNAQIQAILTGSTATDLTFSTWSGSAWGERMRIQSGGNVGIGTTNPGYKLSVEGTGYFTNVVTVGTPTASGHAATKDYVDTRTIAWNKITGFPDACTSGQVVTGMNSTSLTCTTTAGATYTAGNGLSLSGTIFSLAASGTSNYLTKWTGTSTLGSSSIYIKDDGNVGIGSTSPGYKLSVAGGGSFDSPVVVGTPNDGSEAVNVDYLNSAISGLGGDNTVTFAGVSVSTFTGNQGGYDSANDLCVAVDSDSHICTTEDILTITNNGNISTIPTTTEGYWISNGPPGYTVNANDCLGFNSNSYNDFGTVWIKINDSMHFGALRSCGLATQFACCK